MRTAPLALILLSSLQSLLFGQAHPGAPRTIVAVRTAEPIRVDGQLTETVWQRRGEEGFVQREPFEGAEPSQRTEVWFAYDDDALYVAVRLYDSHPDSIIGRVARRDQDSESDEVGVAIDAANDDRTAYYFVVNPVGAITDGTYSNDTEMDDTWDGIWDVGVRTDSLGWCAEFRIPYSQLRFPKRDRYVWGVEVYRRIKRRNEDSYLVLHPRTDRVRVSRFVNLVGIEGIEPPARVELLPYFTSTAKFLQQPPVDDFNSGREDPYKNRRRYPLNLGADAKIGLSGDVTLDASLNPDFAQVEVDPAVVNLTAYEVQYQEKRPFFIEGSSILKFGRGGAAYLNDFDWHDPDFFYSRRIGRAPQASVTHQGYEDVPDRTTILGAAKVSGKITNTWSFAALTALTNREYGLVDSAGVEFKDEIEPLTFYGIARTLKEFNEARQAIGVIGTMVTRDLRDPRLRSLLNSRALSLGVDGWTFLDKEKVWVITGWAGASYVAGASDRLLSLQRSPQHYFQRPDASYLKIDSNATSLAGWSSRVWLDKVSGNWIFDAAIGAIHPKFETNDAGFLTNADFINAHIYAGYQWWEPGKILRTKSISAAAYREYDFSGYKIGETYRLFLNAQLLNYWSGYLSLGYNAECYDDQRTRGGPVMKSLRSSTLQAGVSSDSRKSLYGSLSLTSASGVSGGWYYIVDASLSWKASNSLNITAGPEFYKNHNTAQYVATLSDSYADETFGRRYVFGTLDQQQLSATLRVKWAFTPKLTFDLYLQPLLSIGSYSDIKELARPGTFTFLQYGREGSTIALADNIYTIDPDGLAGPAPSYSIWNPNFNYKSLRANAVLRWEYLPGSTIYLVWTHEKLNFDNPGEFEFGRDVRSLFRERPDNVFSIKITYWFNP